MPKMGLIFLGQRPHRPCRNPPIDEQRLPRHIPARLRSQKHHRPIEVMRRPGLCTGIRSVRYCTHSSFS